MTEDHKRALAIIASRQRKLLDCRPCDMQWSYYGKRLDTMSAGVRAALATLENAGLIHAERGSNDSAVRKYSLTTAGWEVVGDMPIHLMEIAEC